MAQLLQGTPSSTRQYSHSQAVRALSHSYMICISLLSFLLSLARIVQGMGKDARMHVKAVGRGAILQAHQQAGGACVGRDKAFIHTYKPYKLVGGCALHTAHAHAVQKQKQGYKQRAAQYRNWH
jgi:hypothetical protein